MRRAIVLGVLLASGGLAAVKAQPPAANAPKELWTVEDGEHVAVFGNPGPWRERLAAALDAAVR